MQPLLAAATFINALTSTIDFIPTDAVENYSPIALEQVEAGDLLLFGRSFMESMIV